VSERRTNTREQIRAIALEMFAERGYAGTSLREIAERLGVTKAAVYYHFSTKEDILASLLEDFRAQLDELIAWTAAQPRSAETRRAALERYAKLLGGRKTDLARFMQEGQSAIRELAAGLEVRKHVDRFLALLAAPDETVEGRLRAQVALVALHLAAFGPKGPAAARPEEKAAPEDRAGVRAAGLRVAADVLAGLDVGVPR
jgi:AcrR family transcriptional regulator